MEIESNCYKVLLFFFLFRWFLKRMNMSHCMIYFCFELSNPSVHVGRATVGKIIINKEEPSAHVFAVRTHPDVRTGLQLL